MIKVTDNIKAAVGIGLLTIVYLREAISLPQGSANMPDIGYVPVLYAALLILCCLGLIVSDWAFIKPIKQNDANWHDKEDGIADEINYHKLLGFSAALIAYPLLLETVGFLLTTIGLLFVCFRLMEYRNVYWSLGAAIVISIVTSLVFTKWLGVFFPKGLLG